MNFVRRFLTHVRQPKINSTCTKRCLVAYNQITASIRPFTNQTEIEDESECIIAKICKGNKEMDKKIRVIMLEVEVMRQDGRFAPDNIKMDQWQQLLELPSRNQRANYLKFLWKTEKSKENQKAKKEAKRKEFEMSLEEDNREYPDDIIYGISQQSLFLRIRDQSINNFDNYRALQAMTYGVPIIIDCSYEEHMVRREIINAAKQLTLVFGDNRLHKDPFNLHLCNVYEDGDFMRSLQKNIPPIHEPWFPINIHTQSYLDLFPKEKLVYLTPHCREELSVFDPDSVYIIGCMVDKMNNEPLSLAKAKKDGIRMAKLPLDRYLEWAPGSKKSLNINHMLPILSDLKLTGDWEYALRHIPRRKLMATKIMAMQKKFQKTSVHKEDMFRNLKSFNTKKFITRDEKQFRSKRTLYYDDEHV